MRILAASDLALVSNRVPLDVARSVPGLRDRVHVVRDAEELSALRDGGLGSDGRLRLAVLDTQLPSVAGGFDAVDAARVLAMHPEQAGQTLIWVHDSASSVHVAEEVAREYRPGRPLAGRLAGVVCDGVCITRAIDAVYRRRPWDECVSGDPPHLKPHDIRRLDAQATKPPSVLCEELSRRGVGPKIMIAMAAQPMSWPALADVLHFSVDYLRQALGHSVQAAAARLDWIRASDPLTGLRLANLVARRRDYFELFAFRYRREDLYPLFLAA